MNKVLSFSLVIATIISFMGCSGGNSNDEGTGSNSVTTGTAYYIDSAVSGINYKCGSQEGTTGADGSFTFEEGQGCTFYLGDVELRGVDADLLGDGENVYEIDTKIARILQSMDTDGNPDNGITISAEMIEALAEEGITSLPETEEELDAMLDVIEENGGTMVTEDDAQAHLDKTREEAEAEGNTVPTPAPTATPTSAPTPTPTATPTPTPEEPSFQFTTNYLNGKTFYYVQKDDFNYAEMKWNMASMEFTVNTFAWTEYDTADGDTHTVTYSIDAEGNITYYFDEPTDTTVISSPEVTNDYIKVCEDGDCNTYLFFDEEKAMTFRDEPNRDYISITAEMLSGKTFYDTFTEDAQNGGNIFYASMTFSATIKPLTKYIKLCYNTV